MSYDQKQQKCGFLSKVTTVLPVSGRVGFHTETFSVSPELSFERAATLKRLKWQDRGIIQVQIPETP